MVEICLNISLRESFEFSARNYAKMKTGSRVADKAGKNTERIQLVFTSSSPSKEKQRR